MSRWERIGVWAIVLAGGTGFISVEAHTLFPKVTWAASLRGESLQKATATEIYVDQANGHNTSGTAGTSGDPFKSITYAMLTMANRSTPDPWVLHIKPGTYDSDPAKPLLEREIFPIQLRLAMTIQGEAAPTCVISGSFNTNSTVAMLYGEDVDGVTISHLTLKDMHRTGGTNKGGACELLRCSATIQSCVITNNSAGDYYAGAIWVSPSGPFNFIGNTCSSNAKHGVSIEGGVSGDLTGSTFSLNTGTGFRVNGAFTGAISGNTFTGNVTGFSVAGQLTGDVMYNEFSNNTGSDNWSGYGGSGFFADGMAGNIAHNSFLQNAAGGFVINYFSLTGTISDNDFSLNGSGGFFLNGAIQGDIVGNTFSGNNNWWGAFAISSVAGNIVGNTFAGNTGSSGAFHVSSSLDGNVQENTFDGNAGGGGGPGAFAIDGGLVRSTNAITRNLFLDNSPYSFTLGSGTGGGIVSNNFFIGQSDGIVCGRNLTVVNNTFFGRNGRGPSVRVLVNAENALFRNNIFANVASAILGEGTLSSAISHNDFYQVTNILWITTVPTFELSKL